MQHSKKKKENEVTLTYCGQDVSEQHQFLIQQQNPLMSYNRTTTQGSMEMFLTADAPTRDQGQRWYRT